MKVLDVKEKQNVQYCIPLELRDEQIKINLTKVKERVIPVSELTSEPIAIVCFGPSLNDTWQDLKKFKYIMTCSGAHKFLVEKGIIPTHHLDLDPRLHKLKLLGLPQKETQYLIASAIHPQYLDALEEYNVKLWHIFANEGDGARVLPRGEWSITGGSSVGLRCLTVARFLGYINMHIFGMDGSFNKENTHSAEHPNPPKEVYETEYEGKKYLTTPSILHVAKETFHELDQMPDCKFTFYGEGLVQEMSKKYIQSTGHKAPIAFNKPELISQEYIELNQKLHRDNPGYGMGGAKHKDTVIKLSKELGTTSILDYGAGKMQLAKSLDFPIWSYDPAVSEISEAPKPADIVVCTDCLEHIEPDKLQFVLDDLKYCIKKVGYFVISTRQAAKTYSNGKNTHLIVKGKEWWSKKLDKFFDIGSIIEKEKEAELHIVVGVKKKIEIGAITEVSRNGTSVKFNTPNETTKWRADTLFTKEPVTIDWIESFQEGETLIDVGANIGGYTVWAAKRKKVKVIAFEPEADNYALLQKNILLNEIDATAYCAALSDHVGIDKLYLSSRGVGGSCHSFGERDDKKVTQGCIGLRLDDLGIKADHIKIDVDGLEPLVVAGATKLLMNGVKSVLVEVNTNLPKHQEMVSFLQGRGFEYEQSQVDKSIRKEGAFKGCAEYVFRKKVEKVELSTKYSINHVVDSISRSVVETEPFNYLYVEDVFPWSTYKKLINFLPGVYLEIEKSRGTRGYPKRFTAVPQDFFWKSIYEQLLNGELERCLCKKLFIGEGNYVQDLLLIRDEPGYSIPPHTDSTNKAITVLFYLPKDGSIIEEGTSLFTPKQKGFTCKTGRHYSFEDFDKFKTMMFKPNSMLAFARTDNSFHGVEPTNSRRDVLLYNINKSK